jgi:hypothetical protein
VSGDPEQYSRPAQLGRRGSLALGAACIAAQAWSAFTGHWFLFGASVALGAGLPLLGLTAPRRWEQATYAITGEHLDARRIRRRQAMTALITFTLAGAVILVAALLSR